MNKVKKEVLELVNKFNSSNVYELCDYLNIHIRKELLLNIKGYFLNTCGEHFIILNYNLEDWEEKVVLAHELGHYILHKESNICFLKNYTYCVTNKFENEANEFAAHLLMPDEEIKEFSRGKTHVTAYMLSAEFKVPLELASYEINGNLL